MMAYDLQEIKIWQEQSGAASKTTYLFPMPIEGTWFDFANKEHLELHCLIHRQTVPDGKDQPTAMRVNCYQAYLCIVAKCFEVERGNAGNRWKYDRFAATILWDEVRSNSTEHHAGTILGMRIRHPDEARSRFRLFFNEPHHELSGQFNNLPAAVIALGQLLDVEGIYRTFGTQHELPNCTEHSQASLRNMVLFNETPSLSAPYQLVPIGLGEPHISKPGVNMSIHLPSWMNPN